VSALSFANPWIAAGLAGVAAPIIIHFLFRRRARTVEFPAMRFVLMSYKKIKRRLLLHEYALLLTRCLIVALLALAIAVPLLARRSAGISRGEDPLAAVLVIDTSLSMTRKEDGKNLLEKAKTEARIWIEGLKEVDRAGLLDASRLRGTGMKKNPSDLEGPLEDMDAAFTRARMAEAVLLAESWLSDLPSMQRMVVVFTDMQRSSWQVASKKAGQRVPLYLVDVSDERPGTNLSISGIDIEWRSLARDKAAVVKAKIANHGAADMRKTLVKVESEDSVLAQGFADIEAGKRAEKEFVLTEVPDGPGVVKIEADDALPADNLSWFHLKGGRQIRALVVDGEPGTRYIESETYFLDQALNPRLYARSRVQPRTVTRFELGSIELSDFPVIVLANVGGMKSATAERIREFVSRGGGLLITLGNNVDADQYNALFKDLLPRELRGAKLSYAGAAGSSEIRVMHLSTPATGDEIHPMLEVFKNPDQGDLGLAGFWKYFLMQQETAPRTEVILRLTDGVPMMVEGEFGQGRVIVFASTADREWNDLCIHPTYLPLFQQAVQHLADALVAKDEGDMVAGRVIEIPVASDVAGALVKDPAGTVSRTELVEEIGARRIRIGNTELPGVYSIKMLRRGEEKESFGNGRPDRILVLNLDPGESDLEKIDAEEIKARMGSPSVTLMSGPRKEGPDETAAVYMKSYAGHLLMLLVALVVLERALVRKG